MNANTQQCMRTSTYLMYRRARVDHLDHHIKRLKGTCYADTLISKVKSILENTLASVYTQGKFIKVYPILERRGTGQSLIEFTENFDVPETLLTDGVGEFTGQNTDFVKHDRRICMQIQNS